jgi:predicted DNA-binding transcriptional regulator AlpA
MMKNKVVYDLTDICSYYGLSESTIRKKVRESRSGESNFPLPLLKRGCKALWRKSDIEAWGGEDGEVIHITPTLSSVAPVPTQNLNETRKRLEKFGISLPKAKEAQ